MVVWNARAVTPQEEMLPFIRPMRGPQVGKSACIVQLILIKWQLYVTPKKFPDKGGFPFENGVKMAFSLIIYPLELRNVQLQE